MSLQDIWKHKTSAEKDKRVALTQKIPQSPRALDFQVPVR